LLKFVFSVFYLLFFFFKKKRNINKQLKDCSPSSFGSAAACYGRKALRCPVRGHHAPGGSSLLGPLVMTTFPPLLPCLMAFGGFGFGCCRGYAGGGACTGGALFRRQLFFGCLLVIDYRLYLIGCSVLDLAWSLLFSTDL
jgi:hypothetical protein